MSYKGRTVWDKRLPPYIGILVLLFALGLTVILSRNSVQIVTKATVGSTPKNVQISNISATSVTVSFVTDENTLSTIAYGKDPSYGQIALDTRDLQQGKAAEHRVHYMQLQNLEPGVKYYFSITSGAQVTTDNGKPFEVTTAPTITTTPPSNPVLTGSVVLEDGTIPKEGVVYVKNNASQQFASLLQPDGRYQIPLNQFRTTDLTSYLPVAKNTDLQITVVNPVTQSEAIFTFVEDAEVPKIVLSKDYDFTLTSSILDTTDASESGKEASDSADFPVFDEAITATSPEITVPKDNQAFKDSQPLFKGKAIPNTAIELVINSEKEISAGIVSDATGNWEFRPPVALAAGDNVISISSPDINGEMQKITKSFIVNAEGSQFVEPSVSPIEATPTTAPPITPTVASLPSPTASATPTLEPSPTVLPSPTIDPNAVSPTRGPLAETGSYTSIAGLLMSVLFLAGGVILFFSIAV